MCQTLSYFQTFTHAATFEWTMDWTSPYLPLNLSRHNLGITSGCLVSSPKLGIDAQDFQFLEFAMFLSTTQVFHTFAQILSRQETLTHDSYVNLNITSHSILNFSFTVPSDLFCYYSNIPFDFLPLCLLYTLFSPSSATAQKIIL